MTTSHYTNGTTLSAVERTPKLDGKTVLIVDDDKILLQLLAMRCRDMGLRVETATDGLRTLLAIAKVKPDLLILDLSLPDVDGFRVVERLADPKFPPLPIIVLTGRSDDASVSRCKGLGVLYVEKGPHAWQELQTLILKAFHDR